MTWIAVVSTAYCLSGIMADGTPVRQGSVAENTHRLGTHVAVSSSPYGTHRFVIRDRIGWGTQLDFWVPSCSQALLWGRRVVRLRFLTAREQIREIAVKASVRALVAYQRAAAWAQGYADPPSRDQYEPVHAPGG